jgi:hypothetical protein
MARSLPRGLCDQGFVVVGVCGVVGGVVGGVVAGGCVVGGVVAEVAGGVVAMLPLPPLLAPPDEPLLPLLGATCVLPAVWMVCFGWPVTACAVILHCASTSLNTARAR